ncbi:epimerase [Exiguobacterium sp. KRL4]|uniref:sugar nucleotide-binding protein n=1 Tax=Exiguobacterium sp. KRL4 TaxID=1914536 RepID=UPI0008F8A377|nr:sugar nucleotide-binding protein [Exiguobacterium sp. KRL4]OIN67528.1 epimerase [Exiguobacterium sp. KRL4]
MNVLITGMNGTVAPVVADVFRTQGYDVTAWDRSVVSTTDLALMEAFIDRVQPDLLLHIGMGSAEFAETLARLSFERNIPFLFTSTASVYADHQQGPHDPFVAPEAEDEYGLYKRTCERLIQAVNPNAYIVRIGWQIGQAAGSNNMIDYLERHAASGEIPASANWYPSCAFLEDTADTLYTLITSKTPGLYLANGNRDHSFFDIATALNTLHGSKWQITEDNSMTRDDRMTDSRVIIRPISERLSFVH